MSSPEPRGSALDVFLWLRYRCHTVKEQEVTPVFSDHGAVKQLGKTNTNEFASTRASLLIRIAGQVGTFPATNC